jgi:5-methylcytosine-specific restriction endonuclease McrA
MDGVSGRRWRRLCALVLARSTHCALCGDPLHPERAYRGPDGKVDPLSSSVDHKVPRSLGGDVYDIGNLRATHLGCNLSRGNGTRTSGPQPITSHDW